MNMKKTQKISIVIPVHNENENIAPLTKELKGVLNKNKYYYEIIFVDDGSTDKTVQKINKEKNRNSKIKLIELRSHFGKSIALQSGFDKASGEIIVSMDGDLQDNPNELPKFINKINGGFDLVVGWKKKRHDPISKTLPSKVINTSVRILTGIKLHDINCGFKAYKKNVAKDLNLYGDLYRFIPVMVDKKGYKIIEIPVKHRERKHGVSKYGWKRFVSGFLDLITVFFLVRFLRRPGHFFGTIGLVFFATGFTIGLYITYLRITTGGIAYRYPLLFFAVLMLILGVQFFLTGLISELIIFFQKKDQMEEYKKS